MYYVNDTSVTKKKHPVKCTAEFREAVAFLIIKFPPCPNFNSNCRQIYFCLLYLSNVPGNVHMILTVVFMYDMHTFIKYGNSFKILCYILYKRCRIVMHH